MNLLEYANTCGVALSKIKDTDFAPNFVALRSKAFVEFHSGLIISNSHGINYFDNVIKYWDNPISYIEKLTQKDVDNYSKQKCKDDYEKNFILILLENKKC